MKLKDTLGFHRNGSEVSVSGFHLSCSERALAGFPAQEESSAASLFCWLSLVWSTFLSPLEQEPLSVSRRSARFSVETHTHRVPTLYSHSFNRLVKGGWSEFLPGIFKKQKWGERKRKKQQQTGDFLTTWMESGGLFKRFCFLIEIRWSFLNVILVIR